MMVAFTSLHRSPALVLALSLLLLAPGAGGNASLTAEGRADFRIRILQVDLQSARDLRIGDSDIADLLVVQPDTNRSPTVIVVDDATVHVGDRSWPLFDTAGDSAGELERHAPFVSVSAPRIVCHHEQETTIAVGQPIHYLVRDEEGCLRVETDEESFEGLRISVTPEASDDPGVVKVKRLRVSLSHLSSRHPFEDLTLDVGKPIMGSVAITSSFDLAEGRVALVPMPTWDHEVDPIIVVIQASNVRE